VRRTGQSPVKLLIVGFASLLLLVVPFKLQQPIKNKT